MVEQMNRLQINQLQTNPMQTLLCIGDSLTEGDYGSEPEGTASVKQERE